MSRKTNSGVDASHPGPPKKAKATDGQILDIARGILAEQGLGGLSFDAIARALGRSKQAILYWYPTKQDLMAALFLPWLEAETEVAERALADATNRTDAVPAFVEAILAFHRSDLDRFRMMYLAPQTSVGGAAPRRVIDVAAIPPVTDRLYSALEARLSGPDARQEAVAIHGAVLGLVMMSGLAEAIKSPLKHPDAALGAALIGALTKQD